MTSTSNKIPQPAFDNIAPAGHFKLRVYFHSSARDVSHDEMMALGRQLKVMYPRIGQIRSRQEIIRESRQTPKSSLDFSLHTSGDSVDDAVANAVKSYRMERPVIITMCEDMMRAASKLDVPTITFKIPQEFHGRQHILSSPEHLYSALNAIRCERN